NATTPLRPEVRELVARAHDEGWGNPSSHHWAGRRAKVLLDRGRADVAEVLGASVAEIVFVSGASEADNAAIRGVCAGAPGARDTIVLSAIEHPAVTAAAAECASRGWKVVTVGVDADGRLDLARLEKVVDTKTMLVSAMQVNNETGAILPVEEIGRIARAAGALFHCDAVQALGKVPVNVERMRADLVVLAAHKCGGPRGVGALYVRRGVKMTPLVLGGSQERERRAGTENVAGIAAMGLAVKLAAQGQADYVARLQPLRDRLEREIVAKIPRATVHAAHAPRVANTSYVSFEGTLGENLLLALDLEGIAVSGGSACASGAMHPSKTLEAMGVDARTAMGAVRFSLGVPSTASDVDAVLSVLPSLVARERAAAEDRKKGAA
ncbi:MAG TPA: cysteine desulfurase family protein, partial [bacterium]|nr:cysteine desulfurase family protein [bacterium]